jgi:Prp8 binding protein
VWDVRQRHAVDVIEHSWPVTAVSFNATSDLAFAGSLDNEITAYDLRARSKTYSLLGHADSITGLRLSPDGSYLLSNAMDNTVRIWDVKPFSAVPTRMLKVFEGAPHGFDKNLIRPSWSADGTQIACGAGDRSVVVWDTATKKILYKLPGHKGTVNEVDWHAKEPIGE